MRLDIRFSGTKHNDCWDEKLETVLLESLEPFQHWVRHVCLYIEDVNGPKGGIDKQCRCVVHLKRMPPVVIQAEGDNLAALTYRIANRTSHTLNQKTNRKKMRKTVKRWTEFELAADTRLEADAIEQVSEYAA
ncbi:hypothetical protein [Bythopirellula goksoeyrii]|uniref:Sigma 54 modulation protein / S30EA ribosomal protein n=1 Tax=Bythopirellula goksoeyrii TaxID=1400387 RepID=A0A5B9QB99_9BACT|nr:hypothetical protein [Bythopirellula goksoeyrii]QEG36334.1 hypothetical protein Pr1d_36470 [Bythopirellula goksoeyrii]